MAVAVAVVVVVIAVVVVVVVGPAEVDGGCFSSAPLLPVGLLSAASLFGAFSAGPRNRRVNKPPLVFGVDAVPAFDVAAMVVVVVVVDDATTGAVNVDFSGNVDVVDAVMVVVPIVDDATIDVVVGVVVVDAVDDEFVVDVVAVVDDVVDALEAAAFVDSISLLLTSFASFGGSFDFN